MSGYIRKFDVLFRRAYWAGGEERSHWLNLGIAFENEKGIDVVLYAIPPHNEEGETRVMLREPDPQREAERNERIRARNARPPGVVVEQRQQRAPQQPQPQQPQPMPPAYEEDTSDIPF